MMHLKALKYATSWKKKKINKKNTIKSVSILSNSFLSCDGSRK